MDLTTLSGRQKAGIVAAAVAGISAMFMIPINKVHGIIADGSSFDGNPVVIGGEDGSSQAQSLLVNAAGEMLVESDGIACVSSELVGLAADNNIVAAATGLKLHHVSIRESASSPAVATVIVRNGTADTDEALLFIELAANASYTWHSERGLDAAAGVRLDVVAGTVDVTVATQTVTD